MFDTMYWRTTFDWLPELLLGLLVLLIGFFIAKFLENLTYKLLRKGKVNERLGNTESKWSAEKIISKVVFFLVLLFSFFLFFNMMDLGSVASPFATMFSSLTGALLNILKAALILFVAWIIATLVKKAIQTFGNKVNVNKFTDKAGVDPEKVDKTKWTDTFANVAYWLIFLLFIPAVLNALGIDGLSGPFEGMLDKFFAFIPKLVSAAIVFFIGYFAAKLVRNILTKFLESIGTDRLAHKLKIASFFEGTSLSRIIGIIAFVLIMIPVTITALEILDLNGISDPAISMLNDIMEMLPKIAIAIVLVIIGIVVGKWVKEVVENLLKNLGVDSLFSNMGFNNVSSSSNANNLSFAKILAIIAQVVVVLLFVVEALQILELEFMVTLATGIFAYLPAVIAAVIILAVGFWLASLAEQFVGSVMTKASGSPHVLRYVAKYAILAFAFFMALDQLGIAASIINAAFILILGGVALAFGLAFGLGGRDHASRYLDRMEKSIENADVSKEKWEAEKQSMKNDMKNKMGQAKQNMDNSPSANPLKDASNSYEAPSTPAAPIEPKPDGIENGTADENFPYDDVAPNEGDSFNSGAHDDWNNTKPGSDPFKPE
ncbi:mechanosensitive ion channel [Paenisporosarcina cavernae]|uniref:Uncharacterized protein n=1 Tax=Paenisporosarcina cavernae TaxID=2320858 RepID=A0A385YQ62_9BACL|nr:mechanosensitive ion channel [Paenisporosarcina cavernae]AYC28654.1 hypothetical protein D3873_01745 [Paenisporosarcina cavernae]